MEVSQSLTSLKSNVSTKWQNSKGKNNVGDALDRWSGDIKAYAPISITVAPTLQMSEDRPEP
jgi:hypothetical protein